MENNLLHEHIDKILRSYGIPVDNPNYKDLFNGKDPSEEQIEELKKVLAASIVTANDKGQAQSIPQSNGRNFDYNKPEDVANAANETVDYWEIIWDIARGFLSDYEEIINRLIDNIRVQIVSNLEWLVENGVEITIEVLEFVAGYLDLHFPGAGVALRHFIDLIRINQKTIVDFLVETLPSAIDMLADKLKETVRKLLNNPLNSPTQKPTIDIEIS